MGCGAPSTWLPFSRGGDEPWTQARPRREVEKALGLSLSVVNRLEGRAGVLRVVRTVTDEGAPYEDVQPDTDGSSARSTRIN
jgi:hypothetical protein